MHGKMGTIIMTLCLVIIIIIMIIIKIIWKVLKEGSRTFVIEQVDKFQIASVKRLRSGRFEREPFVVTFRLDYEDDVSR